MGSPAANVTVDGLRPDEMDTAVRLMSEAFIRTPFTAMVMGGTGEKQLALLRRGMGGMLRAPGLLVAARSEGVLVGVMRMVAWPECQRSVPRGLARLPMLLFGGAVVRRLFHFRDIWHERDPEEPHWHIDPLAVAPARQGQGIGSALLRHYCAHVDAQGLVGYLETDMEQNVRLYKRFGFEVVGETTILGMPHWFLRRPAAGNR